MIQLMAAYDDASERYRAGEFGVAFPEGTYPPPLISPALPALAA
jgi:hypothetical protein